MRYLILILIIATTIAAFAMTADKDLEQPKAMTTSLHTAGNVRFGISNYGNFTEAIYPAYSGNQMMYMGANWISATKYRRDSQGRKLYWLTFPPTMENNQIIIQEDPLWSPDKRAVVDTLTSIGFDGDRQIYELLPAYNPRAFVHPLYNTNNSLDTVLKSILGNPAPRPFELVDPLGSYLYSVPSGQSFETPGFETHSAYYYDYCPLGTQGDRDYGSGSASNTHYPLGLAIHQESYSWNLQHYSDFVVVKTTIYNSSVIDTLFDVAIASYVDPDIGPASWGSTIAVDDVSGYVKGEGYEFAYARDVDSDGGISPYLIGNKIIIPGFDGMRHCWYWRVGDGPNDYQPLTLTPGYAPRRTANEKYWLMTGRNPNNNKYLPLRPEQDDITEYEQPSPNDTRFLYTIFGDGHGSAGTETLHLAPQASLTYYNVFFFGSNLDDLKARSIFVENFIQGGLNLGSITGSTCIPYLQSVAVHNNDRFRVVWHSYTDPDYFLVMHKVYEAPASQWVSTQLAGNTRQHILPGMQSNTWYEVKVASVYNPGPNEVYLESETRLVNLNHTDVEDYILTPHQVALSVYPNPFNPETTIRYQIPAAGNTMLEIYNIKGQKVRSLMEMNQSEGEHSITWNGTDDSGRKLSSGVYLLRLRGNGYSGQTKLLLMK